MNQAIQEWSDMATFEAYKLTIINARAFVCIDDFKQRVEFKASNLRVYIMLAIFDPFFCWKKTRQQTNNWNLSVSCCPPNYAYQFEWE